MITSLEATEKYSAARSTHPRVSLSDIEEAMDHVAYLQGDSLFVGLGHSSVDHNNGEPPSEKTVNSLKLLSLCLITMKNGFTVVGMSAPASPENYDQEKGRTFAYENAVRQLWPLMGYALRDKLANS